MKKKYLDVRYDIKFLLEAISSNPNGDPSANNRPRCDVQTNKGYITSMCIKRRIRDYVQYVKAGESGYEIYVTYGVDRNKKALAVWNSPEVQAIADEDEQREIARVKLCERYWDVRSFGGVITLDGVKDKSGKKIRRNDQINGPVQVVRMDSEDAISIEDCTITSVSNYTNEENVEKKTMGKKYFVHYALYSGIITVCVSDSKKTGFTEDDFNLLIEALSNMYEISRSDSKGLITIKKIFVFKHKAEFGAIKTGSVDEAIVIKKKDGVNIPRKFDDYEIVIDRNALENKGELTIIE